MNENYIEKIIGSTSVLARTLKQENTTIFKEDVVTFLQENMLANKELLFYFYESFLKKRGLVETEETRSKFIDLFLEILN